MIKNSSIRVKYIYNGYELTMVPKYPLYFNRFINTTIIPDRYISIIFPIIKETLMNNLIDRILMAYPVL